MATHQMGPKPKAVAAKADFDRLIAQELAKKNQSLDAALGDIEAARQKLVARRQMLYATQKAFVESPAKQKAALCTRRAGKTFGAIQLALEKACSQGWDDPNKAQPVIQIIGPTKKQAVAIYWEALKSVARQSGIEAVWNDHTATADFPNGVLLRLGGAKDSNAMEDYRGLAYTLVILDEAASYGPKIESLILDSITMALSDYDGDLAMVGTPGQARVGMFFEVTTDQRPGWDVYKWSFRENLSIPANKRTDDAIIAQYGSLYSPKARREAFGEWVSDASTLVYKAGPGVVWDGILPREHEWKYVLGMDVGYHDPTAFVVVAYSKTTPLMYVVHAEQHPHLLPSQTAEKIMELDARFHFVRKVMDTGGSMARNNMEEWNYRHGLHITPAEKTRKTEFIELMNSEFAQGRIKVAEHSPILKEWEQLVWEDEETAVRHDRDIKEHPGFPNHLSDACLYAFRESLHYRGKTPDKPVEPGTPEFWQKRESDAKLGYIRSIRRRDRSYNKLWR